jgi:hypothetical protein
MHMEGNQNIPLTVQSNTNICVMETNLMHHLSLIYFVNQPLHVPGIFAHHQEVFTAYVQHLIHVIC